ncbi:MAG: hypothetical protein WC055_15360 [Melioribacteraceae bacterium]
MSWIDRIFLLGTGLIAIYLISLFIKEYLKTCKQWNLYYSISFAVLTISGLLLIGLGYGILQSPLVVIVAALIPIVFSMGLVDQYLEKYTKIYSVFATVGFIVLSFTRICELQLLSRIVLITVHSVAGLIIFVLPFLLIKKNKVSKEFAFISVGGALIGVGGIALAFLKAGKPILSAEIIFTILAPLLFLMCASFSIGFIKEMRKGSQVME